MTIRHVFAALLLAALLSPAVGWAQASAPTPQQASQPPLDPRVKAFVQPADRVTRDLNNVVADWGDFQQAAPPLIELVQSDQQQIANLKAELAAKDKEIANLKANSHASNTQQSPSPRH